MLMRGREGEVVEVGEEEEEEEEVGEQHSLEHSSPRHHLMTEKRYGVSINTPN